MTINHLNYRRDSVFVPGLRDIAAQPILGWESDERWGDKTCGMGGKHAIQENRIRVAGYFPLAHVIIGIGLVCLGGFVLAKSRRHDAGALGKRLMIRGFGTLVLGPLLAIADFAKQYFQNKEIQRVNHINKPIPLIRLWPQKQSVNS